MFYQPCRSCFRIVQNLNQNNPGNVRLAEDVLTVRSNAIVYVQSGVHMPKLK